MKYPFIALITFLFVLTFLGCNEPTNPLENSDIDNAKELSKLGLLKKGMVITADRGSGSISVISSKTDELINSFKLPSAPNSPEPMYVVYVRQLNKIFVGDRANSKVVVFNADNFNAENLIDVGNGVFHMWADPLGNQLWVNNDVDKTTSVISLNSLSVIATIPTPSDLASMGGKPHDVILSSNGQSAYISYLGISGTNDYVVKFNTSNFSETGRAPVGKDPHLSISPRNNYLYVPCQGSDMLYLLDRDNLNLVKTISIPGSHGAGMATNGRTFYTTNLPGGGSNGLFAIDTESNQIIGSSNTPYPVPHNITLNTSSKKIYVTHSGPTANKVSVYRVSHRYPSPQFIKEITVGSNPFGIAFAN